MSVGLFPHECIYTHWFDISAGHDTLDFGPRTSRYRFASGHVADVVETIFVVLGMTRNIGKYLETMTIACDVLFFHNKALAKARPCAYVDRSPG